MAPPVALRRRLLNDIAELQRNPYPNVYLHIDDGNIEKVCLILTPEGQDPLHLTIHFCDEYPLYAPNVTMDSDITHPNVYGEYICASILNTEEGWTPAYTLKGIVIQLLSFFCSESLDQDYGGSINLSNFRRRNNYRNGYTNGYVEDKSYRYECYHCPFGPSWTPPKPERKDKDTTAMQKLLENASKQNKSGLFSLPDEAVLLIFDQMETTDIMSFADAIPTIRTMVQSYDFIRIRELQCFCLKTSFMKSKLGIGVSVTKGFKPVLRSEFDLISQEAFYQHQVRRSIQGVSFDKWLPLPLSRRHWSLVKNNINVYLEGIHTAGGIKGAEWSNVLFYFMNTVVVQFSTDVNRPHKGADQRSTLSHASEKAVEAYFALYHLLLCLATENRHIVIGANAMISRFLTGPRDKKRFPDLGHILVAALISDFGLTEDLTFHIIKEAVLRNVTWMLDTKGAGMAELAYLEPSEVSSYRLVMTFHASLTSYRLLMFLKLFSSMARRPGKTLVDLREELFNTHGAPPPGTATLMAQRIREIHNIHDFPSFLKAMGIKDMPSKSHFSAFLKRTITDSVNAGYSVIPLTQTQLYMIRRTKEPNVEATKEVKITPGVQRWYNEGEKWYENGWNGRPSFFPTRSQPVKSGASGRRDRRR